jgi:hypothetical protein
MFKLVAFLFLITAPEEPVHSLTYNANAFPSEAVCREFLDTDEGKAASGAIKMMGYGQGLLVKFACLEAKDNSI